MDVNTRWRVLALTFEWEKLGNRSIWTMLSKAVKKWVKFNWHTYILRDINEQS